jgi:hypothetical protein
LILSADDPFCGTVLTDNEVALLNHNGIRAQLSSLHVAHDPVLFASSITERTHASHAAMVMGSTTIDDSGCVLFLESASSQFESAFLTLAAETKLTKGVYTRWSSSYHVRATHAPSTWQRGISLFWRASDLYEVKEVEMRGPNVLSFLLVLGTTQYYIVGCYNSPNALTTLTHIEQA